MIPLETSWHILAALWHARGLIAAVGFALVFWFWLCRRQPDGRRVRARLPERPARTQVRARVSVPGLTVAVEAARRRRAPRRPGRGPDGPPHPAGRRR
jgi:hypothetical protein